MKAFETVNHQILVDAAKAHGYNPWILRLSLKAYRATRHIGIDGVYSRAIQAVTGITAGSGFATTELRVLLLSLVDAAYKFHPGILFTYMVDDVTIEAHGKEKDIHTRNAGATDYVIDYSQDVLDMEISAKKSCVVGSKKSIAMKTVAADSTGKLTAVSQAKMLGAWGCGGRRRCTRGQQERLAVVVEKTPRVHALRQAGVCAKHLVRTTYTPAALHEAQCMGVSNSHLSKVRRAVAVASAPPTKGKNYEMVLYVADCNGSTLDPAFDAHTLPLAFYATAWWEEWVPHEELRKAQEDAVAALVSAKGSIWQKVTGPVAGAVATAWRLGWVFMSAKAIKTDRGRILDLTLDSPAAVKKEVIESVKRWRLARLILVCPFLKPSYTTCVRPEGTDVPPRGYNINEWLPGDWHDLPHVMGRLLFGNKSNCKQVPQWSRLCRAWLTSASTGGQWTQSRLFATRRGWTDTDQCQLCNGAGGTVAHRRNCARTRPAGGWPKPHNGGQKFIDQMNPKARTVLQDTGLGIVRLKPREDTLEEIRWHMELQDGIDHNDVTWYVDGSLLDGPRGLTAATGAGFVGVSMEGRLLAFGEATPPCWITTIPGVEAWVLQVILSATYAQRAIVTDCLGNVNTLARGKEYATGAGRVLARVWRPIVLAAGERSVNLIWMPAHTTVAAVGSRRRSDGRTLSPVDHRANALADTLAKMAAELTRVPRFVMDEIANAEEAFEHAMALLGVVTRVANGLQLNEAVVNVCEDVQGHRDSMPSSMLARSGSRREQLLRRKREAEEKRKMAEDKALKAEEARGAVRERQRAAQEKDLRRREELAVALTLACAPTDMEDQESREFWESLDGHEPKHSFTPCYVESKCDEDMFVPVSEKAAVAQSLPKARAAKYLTKPAPVRDPIKVKENEDKQNARRTAEKKAARAGAKRVETTTTAENQVGLVLSPGGTGSSGSAAAPPAKKPKTSKASVADSTAEKRIIGAVADFWERKKAKLMLGSS